MGKCEGRQDLIEGFVAADQIFCMTECLPYVFQVQEQPSLGGTAPMALKTARSS
jgi:hypothetical protein